MSTNDYPYIDQITRHMTARGYSQAEFARRTSYSTSVISQYLKRKYPGDLAEVNETFRQYFAAQQHYAQYQRPLTGAVSTAQLKDVLGAIAYVAKLCSFGVVIGEAGLGKTMGFREFQRQNRTNTILLTMDRTKRSYTAFVQYLYHKLPGVRRRKTTPKAAFLVDEIIYHLSSLRRTILIDEAQFLSMDALEVARSIQDQTTECGFVLGGTFDIDSVLGFGGRVPENAQLFSRVKVHMVVEPTIAPADVQRVCALHEVRDPEIAAWLHQGCNQPGRRYRWIHTLITAAHMRSLDYDEPICLATVKRAARQIGLA